VGTHYETLGVSPNAEDVVIDAAYKAMMKRHHPDAPGRDAGKDDAEAKAINEAYRVLRDPETRARYDRDLASGGASSRGWERPADPEPTQPPPPPVSSKPARSGGLVSAGFMGLAATVIVGALGSLGVGQTSSTTAAASSTPAFDAPISTVAAKAPETASAVSEPKTSSAEPTPTPAPVAADTPKPSFDCSRANTDILRLICAAPDLARADSDMAAAYKDAFDKSTDPDALRADQRQWLMARDRSAADLQVLLPFYTQRISQLRNGTLTDLPPF
jgi:uncharacterized protein YecT (DUF1311 family)